MLPPLDASRVWLGRVVGVIFLVSLYQQPVNSSEIDPPKSTTTSNRALDEAMKRARSCVEELKKNVDDYTATLVKRERVKNKLGDTQYMFAKIRNRKTKDGKLETPFGVYMRFLKPAAVKGREVIWVENENDGKLVAHEGGLLGLLTVQLKPEGAIAMMGQRYPITKIGLQMLAEELIERGESQAKYGECEVRFVKGAKIGERRCTLIQVVHPHPREHFDFYRARIFIDDKLNIPIRYAAWTWPETPGGEPVLLEEYTYLNLKINVGLKDSDFDPDNTAYRYP
jgi:hypothetical protein